MGRAESFFKHLRSLSGSLVASRRACSLRTAGGTCSTIAIAMSVSAQVPWRGPPPGSPQLRWPPSSGRS